MSVAAVVRLLTEREVRFALIGARAMALRGTVRSSLDTDFLTTDRRVLSYDFWAGLPHTKIDARRGDFDDPLAGLVRIAFPHDRVDVVVGKYKWQNAVIERAESLDFTGTDVPVVRSADLILLKLFAGGPLDTRDIYDMLQTDPTVAAEVDRLVTDLPKDTQQLWRTVAREIPSV